ncbi:AAA family ATPase [Tsukamurella pulmonis]|uniref:AAA family ATPase n=1 Tax=Tsukamurella pulmonis TaxID=47312 RepID=UPI000E098297|nr:AAA family ATPase [Tsukamurella pulmonis]RDH11545.1 hypothetical protein DVB88_12170 [Tsukamurella pulmonis]
MRERESTDAGDARNEARKEIARGLIRAAGWAKPEAIVAVSSLVTPAEVSALSPAYAELWRDAARLAADGVAPDHKALSQVPREDPGGKVFDALLDLIGGGAPADLRTAARAVMNRVAPEIIAEQHAAVSGHVARGADIEEVAAAHAAATVVAEDLLRRVAELEGRGSTGPEARKPFRDQLLDIDALCELPPPLPLVDGLLYRGTLVQLAAKPGAYKSFFAVSLACSLALGRSFEGHAVPEAARVLYIAAEGASGLGKRVTAWCELSGVPRSDLRGRLVTLPEPVQLGSPEEVAELIEAAREVEAGLIVFDTRALCTEGLEENSATEMGKAIGAARGILAALPGATVLVIHHTGKSEGATPRGSSAWDGAVWSDLRMEGSELSTKLTCAKHKDARAGCSHSYRLIEHEVSADALPHFPEGTDRQTLVLVQGDGQTRAASGSDSQARILDYVQTHSPREGLTAKDIFEGTGIPKSTTHAALNALVQRRAIREVGSANLSRYAGLSPPSSAAST